MAFNPTSALLTSWMFPSLQCSGGFWDQQERLISGACRRSCTVEMWHNFNPVSEDLRANYLKPEMIRKIRAMEMGRIFLEINFSWFVDRIVETQGTREANERDAWVKAGGRGEAWGPHHFTHRASASEGDNAGSGRVKRGGMEDVSQGALVVFVFCSRNFSDTDWRTLRKANYGTKISDTFKLFFF